jgi:hypothetical protein
MPFCGAEAVDLDQCWQVGGCEASKATVLGEKTPGDGMDIFSRGSGTQHDCQQFGRRQRA